MSLDINSKKISFCKVNQLKSLFHFTPFLTQQNAAK